jgi:hypothetical protein
MAWTDSFVKGRSQKGLLPLRDAFQKRGIEVVYFAQNAVGEKMFLPIFEKVAASGADTIYWMTGYTDTITVTKQWAVSAAKDVDLAMVGGAASYANFWNMTGGVALGVINFMPEIPVPYTDKTLPFLKELNAMGAGLLQSTFPAYDTPWVLKAVIEKVRKVEDMDGIIKSLEKTEVQYGSFIWKWGKCHDAIKGYPYFPHTYGQFQGPGKLAMIFPEGVRELVNPNDKFIRVKELRKRAGLK